MDGLQESRYWVMKQDPGCLLSFMCKTPSSEIRHLGGWQWTRCLVRYTPFNLIAMPGSTRGYAHHRDVQETVKQMEKHFRWFLSSQKVSKKYLGRTGYQWRGRTETHILTSGLDDYPRSPQLRDDDMHADLHSWCTYISRILAQFNQQYPNLLKHNDYQQLHTELLSSLNSIHWNKETNSYCDTSYNSQGKTC